MATYAKIIVLISHFPIIVYLVTLLRTNINSIYSNILHVNNFNAANPYSLYITYALSADATPHHSL